MSKSRSGAPRRVAVGLLAGALTVFGFALAPPAGATDSVTANRVAGTTRYGTAAAVSAQSEFTGATTAILATGETFPDALAASGLAGSKAPAPIILTQRNTYTSDAKSALKALSALKNVIIVGGTSAVSTSVENAVKADGYTVTRSAGADRYETAAAIAAAAGTPGTVGGKVTALIANGENYPDALAGGPLSYAGKLPILLVHPGSIPAATTKAITDLGIKQAVILGGTAAVSDAVKTQLEAATGGPAVRQAGTNRFGTAAAIGEYEKSTLAWAPNSVLLASGLNFPDALAGGPLGGARHAPIILTASLPTESAKFLSDHNASISTVTALGGTAAISDGDLTAAKTAASTSTSSVATTRPELVGALIVKTTTTGQATATDPAGTTVGYKFDEAVTGATAALFHVLDATGARTNGALAVIPSSDNTVVAVLYPTFNTAALAATLTTATVDLGAATDTTGQQSPEGDAGIGSAGSSTLTAGTTLAPDLLTVSGFRGPLAAPAPANTAAVDFTFDQTAFVQDSGLFHLVGTDGLSVVNCTEPLTSSSNNTLPSGQNAAGGNGSTIITVTCPAFGPGSLNGQMPSASNVARGYVESAAVGTTPPTGDTVNGVVGESCGTTTGGQGITNRCDPQQSSNTPDAASGSPDLVSASVTVSSSAAAADQVIYVFDENIQPGTVDRSKFWAYLSNGTEVNAPAPAGVVGAPQVNGNQVAVFYATGSLANAVGGSVDPLAVTAVAGLHFPNQTDEVGFPNSTATTMAPDKTAGPDLQSVALSSTTTGFTTTWTAVYTFDQAITAASSVPAKFFLHLADGSRMVCAGPTVEGTGLNGLTTSQVACSGYTFVDGAPDQSGTNTGTATAAQIGSAKLGTVDDGAVVGTAATGSVANPEGASVTTGGTA